MIDDLDRSMERFLSSALADQSIDPGVSIRFAPPVAELAKPETGKATIDLFLYDVRENRERRENQWSTERSSPSNGQRRKTAKLRPPSVTVDFSYLITVWPGDERQAENIEHQVLGKVMMALLKYPRIPAEWLQGTLQGHDPLVIRVLQPSLLTSTGEFWQAMGGKPKPSLHCTVTVDVEVTDAVQLPLVTESGVALGLWSSDVTGEATVPPSESPRVETSHRVSLAGFAIDDLTGQPLGGAHVEIVSSGQERQADQARQRVADRRVSRTAPDGSFVFADLADGQYTLVASIPDAGTRFGQVDRLGLNVENGVIADGESVIVRIPPTAITGRVFMPGETSADDEPVSAKVWLEGGRQTAFTNESGQYVLSRLEPAEHTVLVRATLPGTQQPELMTKNVQLNRAGQIARDVDFEVPRVARVPS